MRSTECIAMILAGGQGSRLGILTKNIAKPAVPFGGKYKIIDFALSNCIHSGLDTVGVLTQYQPLELNTYIGNGQPWDLDRNNGGVYVLPPYLKAERGEWYKGTANAIYQNAGFIEQFNPKYVLVLSGDHIYKMHYGKMIEYHKEKGAAATIAVIKVPYAEASRFGIMSTDKSGRITEFAEKPANPKSNLASMGVYLFDWQMLKKYLIIDENNAKSEKDFGKNVIPNMLSMDENMFAYHFDGYWKDVGTIQSLWEANMELLKNPPRFDLYDSDWTIFSRNPVKPPHFIGEGAKVNKSIITEGSTIFGDVYKSVVFEGVHIGKNTIVKDSILMPGAFIGDNAIITKTIVGSNAVIGDKSIIGKESEQKGEYYSELCTGGITLIGNDIKIDNGVIIESNSMIEKGIVNNQEIGILKQKPKSVVV